eukprot:11128118-Prorocentrum_lima.AAC.1
MEKATRLLASQGHLPRWFGAVVSCVRCGQQAKKKRAIIWAGMGSAALLTCLLYTSDAADDM